MKFHTLRLPAALACLLLALALCACGQTQETPPAPSGVGSADQENTTPSEGMTATASQDYQVTPGEDGTYTVTLDGAQVGGSAWIPYPGADQVDFAAYFDMNDIPGEWEPVKEGGPVEEILQAMWAQRLGPGAKPDHMASNSTVADLEDSIVTDQGGETHYLFAEGDRVYDAWFQEGALTGQQMQAVLDTSLPENLA